MNCHNDLYSSPGPSDALVLGDHLLEIDDQQALDLSNLSVSIHLSPNEAYRLYQALHEVFTA